MPCEYEGAPASRDIAEASFLRALRREKARGPAVRPPSSRRASTLGPPATTPRAQGQAAGAAFANINRADYDRAVAFSTAIRWGAREAQRRDNEAREMAQDPDYLRGLGFHGRDADDD